MIIRGVDNLKLYIIRHGQTEWNTQKRLQGWNNSSLTQKGVLDAENLSQRLKDINFDYIYSSIQKRAIDTANIIRNNRKLDIIKLDGLKEIGFGKWEGMEIGEIQDKYKEEFDIYLNRPHLYKPTQNGESYEDIFKRVKISLEEILKNKGKNVLVVSHGVTLKVLTSIIKEIPLEEMHSLPIHRGTALNICEVKNDKIEFVLEGDTSHMR